MWFGHFHFSLTLAVPPSTLLHVNVLGLRLCAGSPASYKSRATRCGVAPGASANRRGALSMSREKFTTARHQPGRDLGSGAAMGLWESIKVCYFRKYFNFSDRAGRPEYLWFALYSILMGRVLTFVLAGAPYVALVIDIFGFWIPSLAVSARRLHDTNKSNWYLLLAAPALAWLLVGILPPIMVPSEWVDIIDLGCLAVALGGNVALFVLCCLQGTAGPNRYGPAPLPRAK